jgi:transposase
MRIAIEAGAHSPWVSRLLEGCGHEVLVANPRKLRLIYGEGRKTDGLDAENLARLARLDPKLLAPLRHRSEASQAHLALIRSRDALIRSRTQLVNHARGVVKSFGEGYRGARQPASTTRRSPKAYRRIANARPGAHHGNDRLPHRPDPQLRSRDRSSCRAAVSGDAAIEAGAGRRFADRPRVRADCRRS